MNYGYEAVPIAQVIIQNSLLSILPILSKNCVANYNYTKKCFDAEKCI